MNNFQTLNDVSQCWEGSFSNLLNGCWQSTLWFGNTEETPISAIMVHETEKDFILEVRIADIHLVKLNLRITPETVLIQGQPTELAGVEGYFRPSGFESLIPLPHPVEPETSSAQIQPDSLTIQLNKQLEEPRSIVLIELPTSR